MTTDTDTQTTTVDLDSLVAARLGTRARIREQIERRTEQERSERRRADMDALADAIAKTVPEALPVGPVEWPEEESEPSARMTTSLGTFRVLRYHGGRGGVRVQPEPYFGGQPFHGTDRDTFLPEFVEWLAVQHEKQHTPPAHLAKAHAAAEEKLAKAERYLERCNQVSTPLPILETTTYEGRTVLVRHSHYDMVTATIGAMGALTFRVFGGGAERDEDGHVVSSAPVIDLSLQETAALIAARAAYLEELRAQQVQQAREYLEQIEHGDLPSYDDLPF